MGADSDKKRRKRLPWGNAPGSRPVALALTGRLGLFVLKIAQDWPGLLGLTQLVTVIAAHSKHKGHKNKASVHQRTSQSQPFQQFNLSKIHFLCILFLVLL
jgi:hypothetical protein